MAHEPLLVRLVSEPDPLDGNRVVTKVDGMKITVCENRFEIVAHPQSEANEQYLMQVLRQWIKTRRKAEAEAVD
jgi:hypothetical protein